MIMVSKHAAPLVGALVMGAFVVGAFVGTAWGDGGSQCTAHEALRAVNPAFQTLRRINGCFVRGNGTGIRARCVRLAHVTELPALPAAGRVAPRPGLAVRIAAVVVVADALGSRTGGSCPVAVTAVALALYFPRQARETALRLAHGAAVVCCLAVLVALRRCVAAETHCQRHAMRACVRVCVSAACK